MQLSLFQKPGLINNIFFILSKSNDLNFILKGFLKSTQNIIEIIKKTLELKKIACKSCISIHFNNDVLKTFFLKNHRYLSHTLSKQKKILK
jgi:hypothetical protein